MGSNKLRGTMASLAFLLALLGPPAWAATEPYIAYVYPAGASPGTTCLVTVAGQGLRAASGLLFTGEGVEASLVEYLGPNGPLSRVEEEALKTWLAAALKAPREAGPKLAAPPPLPDRPEFRDLEKRSREELRALYERYLNRDNRAKAPMSEVAVFSLRLSPKAQAGRRQLRLVAGAALSNPVAFEVGPYPEYQEPERFALGPSGSVPRPALAVPVTINGQVFPGEVDRFPIALREGEEILCRVSARSLVPYLADAVPGWIQPVIAIADEAGQELARADDNGRDPDPILRFRPPRTATYSLVLRDVIYRGRFDFVYRIEVGHAGKARLTGTVPGTEAGPAWRPTAFSGDAAVASLVEGRIGAPGKIERYSFVARGGETLVAELRARRDGSPLDGLLALYDGAGKLLASNDDTEDREDGLAAQHADPYLRLKLPAQGSYTLVVADTLGRGGPDYAYRLRLGPPREDFAVLTDRSAINFQTSGSALFRVVAIRKDGWDGDIELVLVDPPPGLSLQGGIIPAGRDSIGVTLGFTGKTPASPLPIRLEARARIGGTLVARQVQARDRMMQAFAYNHYVPAEGLYLGFLKGRGKGGTATLDPVPPIAIGPGGSTRVVLSLSDLAEAIKGAGGLASMASRYAPKLELVEPPAGISLSEVVLSEKGLSFLLAAAASRSGFTDNLILRLTLLPLAGAPASPAGGEAKPDRPLELGLIPAFRITVKAP